MDDSLKDHIWNNNNNNFHFLQRGISIQRGNSNDWKLLKILRCSNPWSSAGYLNSLSTALHIARAYFTPHETCGGASIRNEDKGKKYKILALFDH